MNLRIAVSVLVVVAASGAFAGTNASDTGRAPALPNGHFVGTLGGKYAVQMSPVADNGEAVGWYYYESVGIPLTLDGKAVPGRSGVVLEEFVEPDYHRDQGARPRKTGTFTGRFDAASGAFAGQWSSADGKRRLAFKLRKVADYRRIKTREDDVVDAEAIFPHMTRPPAMAAAGKTILADARKANAAFVADARESKAEFPDVFGPAGMPHILCSRLEVHYWSAGLVSMLDTDYHYAGGAHGSTYYGCRNYWIRGGKAEPIALADLFRRGSPYVKALADACMADLQRQGAGFVADGTVKGLDAEDLAEFTQPLGARKGFRGRHLSRAIFTRTPGGNCLGVGLGIGWGSLIARGQGFCHGLRLRRRLPNTAASA